jgi:hypothetical protein
VRVESGIQAGVSLNPHPPESRPLPSACYLLGQPKKAKKASVEECDLTIYVNNIIAFFGKHDMFFQMKRGIRSFDAHKRRAAHRNLGARDKFN